MRTWRITQFPTVGKMFEFKTLKACNVGFSAQLALHFGKLTMENGPFEDVFLKIVISNAMLLCRRVQNLPQILGFFL